MFQSWSTLKTNIQDKQLSFPVWMLLGLSGVLLFVFSLPHAMALRKLLLLIAFLVAFKYFLAALKNNPKPLTSAVLIFILLQVWMLVIAGFVSNQAWASFSEWRGQWLPTLMSFVIGIGLARVLMLSRLEKPCAAIALTIAIPITLFLCINAVVIVFDLIQAGKFAPNQFGIGGQKGITGYQITLLLPILMADLLSRMAKGNRLLPVPVWIIVAVFVLVLFNLIAASSRNGLLILLLAIFLGAVVMLPEIRKSYSAKKIISVGLAALVFVSAIALVSYKTDSRWQTFVETLPIAWDIDRDLRWLDGDGLILPLTPSGQQVDTSEYYRIAWVREGWRMLMANPWGTEISRDTFYNLVLEKYGRAGMAHSHNSWIDLGLQVGIPGLLLWGCTLWLLAKFGWRAWRMHKEPLGMALVLMVIMFAIHGLIDSIFRDHAIEQFMLAAGLLICVLSFGKDGSIRSGSVPLA